MGLECMEFYHFSVILIHFYWPLLLDSVPGFPALVSRIFVETSYLTFIPIQLTGCHVMRYVCGGESWKRLHTVLHMCIYIYVCVYACAYKCGYTCIYIYIYIYIYVRVYVYMYIYIYCIYYVWYIYWVIYLYILSYLG